MKPFSPLFFFFFFLFLILPFHGFTIQNLIQDTCKRCSDGDPNIKFDFCTTSLQAANGSQSANLHGLGIISINLIGNNVTNTTIFIKNMLEKDNLDPYVKECLGDCFQLYSDAISTVTQAMVYYNSSRYYEANLQISSIMDAADTCEDGFSEKDGVVSPLTKRNNITFELSAMSLAVMHLLQT